MISVLTLTYKRPHLLEEAIESFLRQCNVDAEMVIINDNPKVDYVFNHPRVKIINHKERFPSIADKLKWGYQQCSGDWIYRLDDDDLLAPNGLKIVSLNLSPMYEVIRSATHYLFSENEFQSEHGSVNNGNVYAKHYLDRIEWPTTSNGEDHNITFDHNATILTLQSPTMIYRWGMGTLHISGMGAQPNEVVLAEADRVLSNAIGEITLVPHFKHDYYGQIKHTHRDCNP